MSFEDWEIRKFNQTPAPDFDKVSNTAEYLKLSAQRILQLLDAVRKDVEAGRISSMALMVAAPYDEPSDGQETLGSLVSSYGDTMALSQVMIRMLLEIQKNTGEHLVIEPEEDDSPPHTLDG